MSGLKVLEEASCGIFEAFNGRVPRNSVASYFPGYSNEKVAGVEFALPQGNDADL